MRRSPGTLRIRRRDDRLPAVGNDGLGRDLDRDAVERRRGTACAPGPSRRPPRPTRARAARSRTARRLRSRRTRGAGPFIGSPARRARRRSRPRRSAARPAASRRSSAPAAASSSSSERTSSGTSSRSSSRTMIAPPASHEVLCVERLVIAGCERIRHEDRRLAGRRDLPDGRAGAREHEVAGRDRRAEPLRLGEHAVVVAARAAPHEVEVTLAGHVQDRRPARAPRVDDELVQRLRAGERAEHPEHAPVARQLEDRAPRLLRARRASAPGSAGRPRASSRRCRVAIGYERKIRFANGAASRFARPKCASASVSAAGMPSVEAAKTIGPATKPPPPSTTSGRRSRRIRRHARGAAPGEQRASGRARSTAAAGSR